MELPKTSEVPSNIAGTQNKITGLQIAGGRVHWEEFSPTESGYIFKRNHGFQLALDPDQLKSLGITMDVLMDCVKQLEQMGDPEKIKGSIALRNKPGYLPNGLVITSTVDPRVKMSVMFHDPDYEDTDFLVAWFIDNEHLDHEMKTDSPTHKPERTVDADELGPAQAQKEREAIAIESVFNEEELLGLTESAPLNLVDKIRTDKPEYLKEDFFSIYLKPGLDENSLAEKIADRLDIEVEVGKNQLHLYTDDRDDMKKAVKMIGEKNITKIPDFPDLIPSGMTPLFPKKKEAVENINESKQGSSMKKNLNETGEMFQDELEPGGDWHEARQDMDEVMRDAGVKGKVMPFDQYQGPVGVLDIHDPKGFGQYGAKAKIWLNNSDDPMEKFTLEFQGEHTPFGNGEELKDILQRMQGESKTFKGRTVMEGNKKVEVTYEQKFEDINSLSFEAVDFWGLPKALSEADYTYVGQNLAKPTGKEGTPYTQKPLSGKPEYSKTVKEYDSEEQRLQASMKSNEGKMRHVQPGDELEKPSSKVGDEYGQKDLNKKNIKVGEDPKTGMGDHEEGTGKADTDGKQFDDVAKNKVKVGKPGDDHGDHVEEARKMKKKPSLKERMKMKADMKKKRMKTEAYEHNTMGVNKEPEGAPASPGMAKKPMMNRMEALKKRYEHAKKAYEAAKKPGSTTESKQYSVKKTQYEWQKKKLMKQAVR